LARIFDSAGTAMRLDEGTSFPTAMALAAGESKDAYTMGKITALESAPWSHWIYAPDADVNNNPGNPIINRVLRRNPSASAKFVGDSSRRAGKTAAGDRQAFSGHGDTAADSHIDLPVIRAAALDWIVWELVPFRAAIPCRSTAIHDRGI